MKTIHKYILDPNNKEIFMQKGAVILTTREQGDNIYIWAEVDTDTPIEPRYFEIFGTGHEMHEDIGMNRKYIGTAMMEGGDFIFHVYEVL